MRQTFAETILQLTEKDDRIFLLTADMGFSVLEKFIKKFPDRYLNVGVAEADMIGIAAGLAMSGKIVYAYTMSHFLTARCYEQIKIDLCYQNTNVKLVGSGGGLTYGSAGATHHSLEDISIMRSLPNMCVVCPGDPLETRYAIKASLKHEGPVYVRLGKTDPNVYESDKIDFKIGKGILLRKGGDVNILATGNMLWNAKAAADRLEADGLKPTVVSMHTIKPLDVDLVEDLARTGNPMFTVEEHSIIGGLGSAVSEVLAELGCSAHFRRIGLPDEFCRKVGCQDHLRKECGLDVDGIYSIIKKSL